MKALAIFIFTLFLTSPGFAQSTDINEASGKIFLKSKSIQFDFHKISDTRNGYKIQSNGSPQQLWIDLNNPDFLHAVFVNSQVATSPWADRTCLYFGSTDAGINWLQFGSVPDTSRAGFPAIYGTSDGAAVIVNHNSYFGSPTRSTLFIDSSPFQYNFSAFDPGTQPTTIWPTCLVLPDGDILLAATAQGPFGVALNIFYADSSKFSGWSIVAPGAIPQSYSLKLSSGGKIGFTYISDYLSDRGDVFYFESTDGGLTWSELKIFDCPAEQGIAVGALRGIDLNFYGEEPCVVFEVCKRDFNMGRYFSRLPNEILFWSPNINSGVSKVIADSSNVPFAPNLTGNIVQPPLGRPIIGRSETQDWLYVAFNAATENVYVGTDTSTYFAGYIMYSTNGGETWIGGPEKFTPEEPLLDWKYISGLSVFPVLQASPIVFTLHFVMQADSLQESPDPNFLSSQYYHASFTNNPPSVGNENFPNTFRLEQNYPNPFNPNTKIKYTIPSESFVQLKVYDVLGNEVATLVNEEKPAGNYVINFSAEKNPSGVYFYALNAGDFIQTKKMLLLK